MQMEANVKTLSRGLGTFKNILAPKIQAISGQIKRTPVYQAESFDIAVVLA